MLIFANKRKFFCLTLLLFSLAAAAGGAETEASQVRALDSLFTAAMRMKGQPQPGDSIPRRPIKCGFSLLNQIRVRLSEFPPHQRIPLSKMVLRPSLPFYAISPNGRFRIHYALSGSDAVSGVDAGGNGIPDYVDEAANSLENAYHVEVEELGFKEPPADDTDGPEWDVYIENINDSYGSTMPDRLISVDPDVYTSYIEVDNDYKYTDTRGLNGLRVTIAHEFFHMVQLGYNARQDNTGNFTDVFLWEAGSTWMEDVVYDGINDYYYYLEDFFRTNNRRFDTADGWREYGLCLWFHFLEKRLGTRGFAVSIWNHLYEAEAVEANDRALREFGTTFPDALGSFSAWNYRTGSRADTVNFYPEGDAYPEIIPDGTYSLDEQRNLSVDITTTGSRYYAFDNPSAGRYTFVFTNARITDQNESDALSLDLTEERRKSYVRIDDLWYARVTAEADANWRNMVFIEKPGADIIMKAFDDSSSSERMPASIPNPIKSGAGKPARIPFRGNINGLVRLSVFTASGYLVYDRPDENPKFIADKLWWEIEWAGKNGDGRDAPGGIYLYVIAADGKVIRSDKIAVVR